MQAESMRLLREDDVGSKEVSIPVTVGVGRTHAVWSSLHCLAKANFRIEVTKAWAHRKALAFAGTFGWDRINQRI